MYQTTELPVIADEPLNDFEKDYAHLYESVNENPNLFNDLHAFILQYSKIEAAEEKIFNCHLIYFVYKLRLSVKEELSLWEALCERGQKCSTQSSLHYLLNTYIKIKFDQKNHKAVLLNSTVLQALINNLGFYTEQPESVEIFKKIDIYLTLSSKELLSLILLEFMKMQEFSMDLLSVSGFEQRLKIYEKFVEDYYLSMDIMLGLKKFADRKKILDLKYVVNQCLLVFYDNIDPKKYENEIQAVHINTLNMEATNDYQYFSKGDAYLYLKRSAHLKNNFPLASDLCRQAIQHFVQVINFKGCDQKRYNKAIDKLISCLVGYIYYLYFQPALSAFFHTKNRARFLNVYEAYEKEYSKNKINMEKLNIKIDLLAVGLFVNTLEQTFINEDLQTIAQMITELNQILDDLMVDGKESSMIRNIIKKKLEYDFKIIEKSSRLIENCDLNRQNSGSKYLVKLTELLRECIKSSEEINDDLRLALLYTRLMKTAKVNALTHCEKAFLHLTRSIELSLAYSYDDVTSKMLHALSGISKIDMKTQLKKSKEAFLQFLIQIPKGNKMLAKDDPIYLSIEENMDFFQLHNMHAYLIAYSDILIALMHYYESLGQPYPIYKELRARIMSPKLTSFYCLISPIQAIESYKVESTIHYCKKYIEIFQEIEETLKKNEVVYVFTRLFELLEIANKPGEVLTFMNMAIQFFPEDPLFLKEKAVFQRKKLLKLMNGICQVLLDNKDKVLQLVLQFEGKERQLYEEAWSSVKYPKMQVLWATVLQLSRDLQALGDRFNTLCENIDAMALKMTAINREDLSCNQLSLEKARLIVSEIETMLVECGTFEPRSLIEQILRDYNQYAKLSVHFLHLQEDLKKKEEEEAERLDAQKRSTLALAEKKCIETEKTLLNAGCHLLQAEKANKAAIIGEEKANLGLSLELIHFNEYQTRQQEAVALESFGLLEQTKALKYEEECFDAQNDIINKQAALEQELQLLHQKEQELSFLEEKKRLEELQLKAAEQRQPFDSKFLAATAKEFIPVRVTIYPPKNGSMNGLSFFYAKQIPMSHTVQSNSYLTELYLMNQELQFYGRWLQIFGSVSTKLTFSCLNANPHLAQFIPINDVDLCIPFVQNTIHPFDIQAFLIKFNFSIDKRTDEYIKAKKMHGNLPLDLTILTSAHYESQRFIPLTMCWAEFINADDGSERIVNLDPYLLKVFIQDDDEDIFKNAHLEFLVKTPEQKYRHYGDKISDYAYKLFMAMPNMHFSRKVSARDDLVPVSEAYDLLGNYYLELLQAANNRAHYEMVYLLSKTLAEDLLIFKLPVISSFYFALITKKLNDEFVFLKTKHLMVDCCMKVCQANLINKNCAKMGKRNLMIEIDNIAEFAIHQFRVAEESHLDSARQFG